MTNEDVIKSVKFYKQLGLKKEAYTFGSDVKNIYDLLKFKPQIDENGNRIKTPYELLSVPPIFDDQGNEMPIFFMIKNRVNKIHRNFNYGQSFVFVNKDHQNVNRELLKYISDYKSLMTQLNFQQAESVYEMINLISGGKANELVNVNINYLKFYKSMKKQLLIDIFSHFFLLKMIERKNLIKLGIIKTNKKYHQYKEKSFKHIKQYNTINDGLEDISKQLVAEQIKIETTLSLDDDCIYNESVVNLTYTNDNDENKINKIDIKSIKNKLEDKKSSIKFKKKIKVKHFSSKNVKTHFEQKNEKTNEG